MICLVAGPAIAEPLYDTPVYDPETGSYFELRRVPPGYSQRGGTPATTWSKARVLARQSAYKGARGRLAIVKSGKLNDFLRETFNPDQGAWIGLRYWCEFNRLQWVTGELHDRAGYANWARIWNRDGGVGGERRVPECGPRSRFWPVHYWPAENGFRWNANGNKKEMRAFFIEYPLGQQ